MNTPEINIEIKIDWSEIDLFGHINNLSILKYVQSARVHYLEIIGLMQMQSEAGIGPILASTACQFRKPLFYPGKVVIFTKIDVIRKTSFHFSHKIANDNGEIVAEAQDIVVFYDFNKQTKTIIPDELKEKIAGLV